MSALRYGIPFLFLATAPLGFALGGAWAFMTLAIVPLAMCGFDWALGFETETVSAPEGLAYRLLPWLYIAAQVGVTIWAATRIAAPDVSMVAAAGLTLSIGVTTGIFGMLAAHEMVHRDNAGERAIGLTMLACCGYMHFRIAHIHGHHVRGATPDDPTSARRGETAYGFVVRSVVGQVREAWAFEAARLRRRDKPAFSLSNRMLLYLAVEFVILAVVAAYSPRALAFWVAQAALSVILLELFNYIAHYGLARRPRPAGGFERLGPQHAWNSSRRMNNWALFNMGRHSDHHASPTRAYQCLEAEAEGSELPTGYAGSLLLALIPPLWRKVMDPRVEARARVIAALDIA